MVPNAIAESRFISADKNGRDEVSRPLLAPQAPANRRSRLRGGDAVEPRRVGSVGVIVGDRAYAKGASGQDVPTRDRPQQIGAFKDLVALALRPAEGKMDRRRVQG